METWTPFLLVFGFIGVAIVLSAIGAKKRRDALARLARENGWHYVRDGREYYSALKHFPLMDKGRLRRATNVLHGGDGPEEFWLFDYQYTIGRGKHSKTHRQTVVAFPHLNANLPLFEMRPEHIFHKLGSMFGYQDIDLPQHGSFSSRFLLRGKDASAIRDLFDADLVRTLDSGKRRCVEGGGSCLIVYRHREKANTNKVIAAIDHARTIRDAFVKRARRTHSSHTISPIPTLSV